jgi:hypothetical protein
MSPHVVDHPGQSEFDHFVLTRFNVRVGLGGLGVNSDWLAARIALFERYCRPAMRAQTCSNFTWLVFVDADTPSEQKRRIESLLKPTVPVYVDGPFSVATVQAAVLANRRRGRQFVITTRLDNDDAVSCGFIADVQRRFVRQPFAFVNPTYGYELANGRLYWRADPANPFVSLIERCGKSSPETALLCAHEQVRLSGPVEQMKGKPKWLQVVHEHNLVNTRRGIRVPLRKLGSDFELDLDLDENPLACRLERLVTAGHLAARTCTKTRKLKKVLRVARG